MKFLIIYFLFLFLYSYDMPRVLIDCDKKVIIPKSKNMLKEYSFFGDIKLKPFYIGKYEVTNAEYMRYLKAKKKLKILDEYEANEAVTSIDFYTAQNVCKFYKGRLPTEKEWILAASIKINNTNCFKKLKKWKFYPYAIGRYPLSENDSIFKCFLKYDDEIEADLIGSENNEVENSYPNINGTFGMFGNVWEWTSSDIIYYKKSYKIIKGGSYSNYKESILFDNRIENFLSPFSKRVNVGFRCVWEKK